MVSVESLLSEVTTLFGYHLALRAADELFLVTKCSAIATQMIGQKEDAWFVIIYLLVVFFIRFSIVIQFYSYYFSAMSDGNRDTEHRKGKRKDHKDKSHSDDTHETPIASDGLRDAIASARMTIKQALEDTNGGKIIQMLHDLKRFNISNVTVHLLENMY
ncbi:hypothetical protein DINM_000615 [Dirofilaria immitis]|nr:hypothetical protein [Dirofilaria immitis]